jgi:hypothetical protein
MIALLWPGGLSAQNPASPLLVTISAQSASMKAGAQLWIKLLLTNTSDQTIHLAESHNSVCEYAVTIKASDGSIAPNTTFGKDLTNRGGASGLMARQGRSF